MIANRQLGWDDYRTIYRRRRMVALIPALFAPLVAFLISFALSPKYTSRSILFVEAQVVPSGYVKPIVTQSTSDRMISLEQQVLSRSRLEPLVARLGLARQGRSVDAVVEDIRNHVSIVPAEDPSSPPPEGTNAPKTRRLEKNPSGFMVSFTANEPRDAQQICAEVTSALLKEDLQSREQVTQSITELLTQRLEEVKGNLDDFDNRLAVFKKKHIGQLPSDAENNLRTFAGLNARLDAANQALSRAQQDKVFSESILAQEEAAWKQLQVSPELPALQQKLLDLQDKLITLQVRYTGNYPEIAKIKSDIVELKAKIKDASGATQSAETENLSAKHVPLVVLQLRQQVHQSEDVVATATSEQKRIKEQIEAAQSQLAISPDVEQQYKLLTRDSETAQKLYDDLLAEKSEAEMQTEMERRQEGQQMRLLYPASLPGSPSFPVRWKFAVYGLVAGLGLGLGAAVLMEMRDQSLRNEGDVLAGLGEPMLGSVSWVGRPASGSGLRNRFLDRLAGVAQ